MGTFLSTGKCDPGCWGLGKRVEPATVTSSDASRGGRAMASSSTEQTEDRPLKGALHSGQRSLLKRSVSLARAQILEVVESSGLRGQWLTQLQESCKLLSSVEAQLSANTDGKLRNVSIMPDPEFENGSSSANRAKTVRRVLIDGGKEDEDDEHSEQRLANKCMPMGRAYSKNSREVRKWVVKNYTHGNSDLEDVSMSQESMSRSSLDSGDEQLQRRRSFEIDNAPEYLTRCLQNQRLGALLEKVGQIEFDTPVFCQQPEVGAQPVTFLFAYTLHSRDMLGNLPDSMCNPGTDRNELQARLHSYMKSVDEAYLDVIYHNRVHAADVMMMMHWLLSSVYMEMFINPFDHLMCLLAGATHDMGHDGVNNLFHVKARSSLALRYSDRSVLESFHAALAFETMRDNPETNWYGMLNSAFQPDTTNKAVDLQQYMRKGMTDMILMTDTTKHDHLLKLLNEHFTGKYSSESSLTSESHAQRSREELRKRCTELQEPAKYEKKSMLMQVLLHAADISNPCRPRKSVLYFTRRVLMEFWAQGDEERRLGLEVSPLCDRAAGMAAVPSGQIGFANFVVQPLFKDLSVLILEVSVATGNLKANLEYWQKLKEENAQFSDIFGDEDQKDKKILST